MTRKLPLYDTLKKRADEGALRLHMPGHKGKAIGDSRLSLACEIDFTELYGTGNLYDGVYPIADAEQLCAKAFGVPQAFFLTGGASMGIFSMLAIARSSTKSILVDRGAHKSVYHAAGLLDFDVHYLMPEYIEPFGIAAPFDVDKIEHELLENTQIGAVIITCPTYYGICSDISKIAALCHEKGVLLLVDEAHGAHFPFIDGVKGAVTLGADMAVCSMHKTLPALGQAALLLASDRFPDYIIRRTTSIFGTSSPSYQVMASMDIARDFMEHEGREICKEHIATLRDMRHSILKRGKFIPINEPNSDPMRLCVMTSCAGISGYRAARILEEEFKIVCEMADERQVLFIITPADTKDELLRLESALLELERYCSDEIFTAAPLRRCATAKYSIGEAMKKKSYRIPLEDSLGKVAAINLCPYPPGIPVVAVGEVIEEDHLEYLYHNGFMQDDLILVIDEK